MKVPERNVSPEAVRANGGGGRQSIERDVRDAVGLGIEGGSSPSTTTTTGKEGERSPSVGEREFGTGS
jgi:hypothetical protein